MAETNDNGPAIEVKDLTKRFGRQTVLNGVALAVQPRETVVVLGRSGTGKSVLLKLLVGLHQPDRGSIKIHGRELNGLRPDELDEVRTHIGFLFQEGALYDSLSLEENVAFPLRHHDGHLKEPDIRRRVRDLLGTVGMEQDARKRPAEISGGMRKRVGLARALALEPDIILFDEPTAGLDPITSGEIDELILKLKEQQQVASIVVTHDIHSARAVADRLVFLHEGAVIAEGTFEALQADPHPVVKQFLREVL